MELELGDGFSASTVVGEALGVTSKLGDERVEDGDSVDGDNDGWR